MICRYRRFSELFLVVFGCVVWGDLCFCNVRRRRRKSSESEFIYYIKILKYILFNCFESRVVQWVKFRWSDAWSQARFDVVGERRRESKRESKKRWERNRKTSSCDVRWSIEIYIYYWLISILVLIPQPCRIFFSSSSSSSIFTRTLPHIITINIIDAYNIWKRF